MRGVNFAVVCFLHDLMGFACYASTKTKNPGMQNNIATNSSRKRVDGLSFEACFKVLVLVL